jgi:predicted ribosome quality control (RQC) complex YloA/Tae2 family protein
LGVSPALVEELCLSAGVPHSAEPATLSPEQWQALHDCWKSWLTKLHSKAFNPCSCSSSKRFSVLGSYPDQHSSVHDLLDGYYFSLQAGEVYGGLYQRLAAAVKVALKKARGRVYSFEQQLSSAVDAGGVQKQGDIIVANLYRWV